MISRVEPLLNYLQKVNHYNSCLKFGSVSYRKLISLKSSFLHCNNSNYIIPVCELPLVPRLLPNIMVCNKWSNIRIISLIQHSPVNYHYCHGMVRRYYTTGGTRRSRSNRSTFIYSTALAVVVLGLSYAAVPLYRMFCQVQDLWTVYDLVVKYSVYNSSSNRSPCGI